MCSKIETLFSMIQLYFNLSVNFPQQKQITVKVKLGWDENRRGCEEGMSNDDLKFY
jgi:hypothetical protein